MNTNILYKLLEVYKKVIIEFLIHIVGFFLIGLILFIEDMNGLLIYCIGGAVSFLFFAQIFWHKGYDAAARFQQTKKD